jgi:hypothetical protein
VVTIPEEPVGTAGASVTAPRQEPISADKWEKPPAGATVTGSDRGTAEALTAEAGATAAADAGVEAAAEVAVEAETSL